jgi:nickel-dependent lactate racemase
MTPERSETNRLPVRFGRRTLHLQIPAGNLAGYFHPGRAGRKRGPGPAGSDPSRGIRILEDALERTRPGFEEAVRGRSVALLISDGTREEPRDLWAAALAPFLRGASEVLPVLATGSHDPRASAHAMVVGEVQRLLARAGVPVLEPFVHDTFGGPFREMGRTSRGTPLRISERPLRAETLVIVSDMKPHYFAGYSCPPKFVFPGLAALASIEANHSMTLDPSSSTGRHPWHPDPGRRGNPLAADCCQAFEKVVKGKRVRALTFGSTAGEILWAEAGPVRDATARAIRHVDETCGVVTAPAGYVVVSPGGYPNDIDLYVGQRALELTGSALADGGEVLFLCACEEGLGPAHATSVFVDPLRGDLEKAAAPAAPYRLYAHKAIRFARMIRRLGVLRLHSELSAADLSGIPIAPAEDPQAVIDGWVKAEPGARILVLDGANKLSVSAP